MARYAITFDLDTEALKLLYRNDSWQNAYADIRRILSDYGFERTQGSVYFSEGESSPVECVVAVQAIADEHEWFASSVRDLRMLRIEDENDLMPAIRPTNRRRKAK